MKVDFKLLHQKHGHKSVDELEGLLNRFRDNRLPRYFWTEAEWMEMRIREQWLERLIYDKKIKEKKK